MATTKIIELAVPRLVRAECKRCAPGNEESLAVVDVMPLGIASVDRSEAPLAISKRDNVAGRVVDLKWRAFGGSFYRPLSYGGREDGCTPEQASRHLAARAAEHVTSDGKYLRHGDEEEVFPIRGTFEPANVSRGLRDVAFHPIRRMVDDGVDRQRRHRVEAERNLLLVDGVLHHRAPAPYQRLVGMRDGFPHVMSVAPYLNGDMWKDARERHDPWFTFLPHEEDDLATAVEAFLSPETAARYPLGNVLGTHHRFRVEDEDAYRSVVAASPELRYADSAAGKLLGLLKDRVGSLPDDAVHAYLELRRRVAAGFDGVDANADFAPVRNLCLEVDTFLDSGGRFLDAVSGLPSATAIGAASRFAVERFDLTVAPRIDAEDGRALVF